MEMGNFNATVGGSTANANAPNNNNAMILNIVDLQREAVSRCSAGDAPGRGQGAEAAVVRG